jgi:hypothetical protein
MRDGGSAEITGQDCRCGCPTWTKGRLAEAGITFDGIAQLIGVSRQTLLLAGGRRCSGAESRWAARVSARTAPNGGRTPHDVGESVKHIGHVRMPH